MSVWVESEERGIEMFESEQNRVEPQLYIKKRSLIDREVSRKCRRQKGLDRLKRC